MTTADAVRRWLGPGRLLPLGGAADGIWLTERAAAAALGETAAGIPGVRPGRVRLGPAGGPERSAVPVPPIPPGGLPPGVLRIEADFAAGAGEPLPVLAAALREALLAAASAGLGLEVREADLRVTALLDPSEEAAPESAAPPPGPRPAEAEGPAGSAAASVEGVAHLTAVLGPAVHTAPDHVRVEAAIARGHHPLTVARAVRVAVSAALGTGLPVTVLVTAVNA
ncbi:hypothetical protein [Streptomyces sp. CAU 1734]|uniref:hypothetical protein n=1 Tax=Streptomyces sp. CAU 1734 TaxID=3140360 RepID=UPI0032606208